MTTCHACKAQNLPDGAKRCQFCGSRVKDEWDTLIGLIAFAIMGIVVLIIVLGLGG